MPTYTYACTRCAAEFDIDHGMHEQPAVYCPNCPDSVPDDVKRIISACSFQLKGRSWARDGYK